MRNDSKSGLCIYEIIATLCAFIIITSSTQLLVSNNKNTEQSNNEEQIQENNTIAEDNTIVENTKKEVATTSRFGVRREEKSIKISKDMDLSVRTGISKQEFKELMKNLKKDKSGFFKENSDLIYDLCEKYELNEIFFCGLIAGESGWNIATSHREKCNYISMMYKGKLIKYDTPKKGLEAAAKLLHKSYLSVDGAFYSGKTLKDVQKIFCPNSSEWVDLVYSCMEQIIG